MDDKDFSMGLYCSVSLLSNSMESNAKKFKSNVVYVGEESILLILVLWWLCLELDHQTQSEAVDASRFVLPQRWLLRHSFSTKTGILVAGLLLYMS